MPNASSIVILTIIIIHNYKNGMKFPLFIQIIISIILQYDLEINELYLLYNGNGKYCIITDIYYNNIIIQSPLLTQNKISFYISI